MDQTPIIREWENWLFWGGNPHGKEFNIACNDWLITAKHKTGCGKLRNSSCETSMLLSLAPTEIRFMQNSISANFRTGQSVNRTIGDIEKGRISVEDLPMIRVVRKYGNYYAFDNRRLYVYRVLEHRGILDTLEVEQAPSRMFKKKYFTTTNNGASIKVKVGRTLPHSRAADADSADE